jgi:hypothetical protein
MKDLWKRETTVWFTEWDLNTKWVNPRDKSPMKTKGRRRARRNMKQNLNKTFSMM